MDAAWFAENFLQEHSFYENTQLLFDDKFMLIVILIVIGLAIFGRASGKNTTSKGTSNQTPEVDDTPTQPEVQTSEQKEVSDANGQVKKVTTTVTEYTTEDDLYMSVACPCCGTSNKIRKGDSAQCKACAFMLNA